MTPFTPYSLNIGGQLMNIDRPLVMGVINVTPDSFHAASRATDKQQLASRVKQMVADGADVIDVGACSTRPGSEPVSAEQELTRLQWALEVVRDECPRAVVSVDTFRADVARQCVEQWGVDIINDVSGGTLDASMDEVVASLHVPYIVTHMRGTPASMDGEAQYDNVTAQVLEWLARRIDALHSLGVADVIADPGFGLAKNTAQNYELMRNLAIFHSLQVPLMVGVSRKRMICEPLHCTAVDALNGTTVINTVALLSGAHILRVHDVRQAVEARELVAQLRGEGTN